MYMCMHVCMYACMRVCVYVWMYIARSHGGMYVALYLHTYMHTYTHTHIHTHIHTYIHTHIHTYIHTYLPAMEGVIEGAASEHARGVEVVASMQSAVERADASWAVALRMCRKLGMGVLQAKLAERDREIASERVDFQRQLEAEQGRHASELREMEARLCEQQERAVAAEGEARRLESSAQQQTLTQSVASSALHAEKKQVAYTCIHAYMRTCVHAYMHTCIHTYMHAEKKQVCMVCMYVWYAAEKKPTRAYMHAIRTYHTIHTCMRTGREPERG